MTRAVHRCPVVTVRMLVAAALLATALGCGGGTITPAKHGGIRDVVIVLKGSDEPLPFDPRGGRLTIVTQGITRTVGHPVILELDTALSPELKASLEETVLASFETIARELVLLRDEDPEMFARARAVERVVCSYDAAAKQRSGALQEIGMVFVV
jgi:hypothetical protein